MSGKYALLIGNGAFRHRELARLSAPSQDVRDLANLLESREIGGFHEVQLRIDTSLVDARNGIDWLFSERSQDDVVLFYYSGHGLRDVYGKFYLAMTETDPERPRAGSIDHRFLVDSMNESGSRRQLIILDCCYAGALIPNESGLGGKAALGPAIARDSFEPDGHGRFIMAATTAAASAYEHDGRSIYTRCLIDGLLTGAAAPGREYVSVTDLHEYVARGIVDLSEFNLVMRPQLWVDSITNPRPMLIARNPLANPDHPEFDSQGLFSNDPEEVELSIYRLKSRLEEADDHTSDKLRGLLDQRIKTNIALPDRLRVLIERILSAGTHPEAPCEPHPAVELRTNQEVRTDNAIVELPDHESRPANEKRAGSVDTEAFGSVDTNIFLQAFQSILFLMPDEVGKCVGEDGVSSWNWYAARLTHALEALSEQGVGELRAKTAVGAIAASVDYLVSKDPSQVRGNWRESLFSLFIPAEPPKEWFFRSLIDLERKIEQDLDLISLFYHCLALGFEGEIEKNNFFGTNATEKFLADVEGMHRTERSLSDRCIVEATPQERPNMLPIWVLFAAAVVVCASLFLFLSFRISGQTSALGELARALPPAERAPIYRPPFQFPRGVGGAASSSGPEDLVSRPLPRAALTWRRGLAAECNDALTDRYPFAPNGPDANLMAVSDFLGSNGTVARFLASDLAPLLDTSTTPWRWRLEARLSGFTPESAAFFESAVAIGDALFSSHDQLPLTFDALAQVGNPTVALGGASAAITDTPSEFSWPGPNPDDGFAITFADISSDARQAWRGPWGLLRFLDGANVRARDDGLRFLIDFRFADARAFLQLSFTGRSNLVTVRGLMTGLTCPSLL